MSQVKVHVLNFDARFDVEHECAKIDEGKQEIKSKTIINDSISGIGMKIDATGNYCLIRESHILACMATSLNVLCLVFAPHLGKGLSNSPELETKTKNVIRICIYIVGVKEHQNHLKTDNLTLC